jgi:thiamine biosynthesis lipoprotein
MLKVAFRAMGCQMAAFLDREDDAAALALRRVPGWFETWEQALSRFRPDSELSRLNASGGQDFLASPVLWDVLQAALAAAEWTGGVVAPTLLNELERAGYDRSFELLDREGASHPPHPYAGSPPALWKDIRLNPAGRLVRLPPGCRLDFGGVAKGWAAQQAMLRLRELGPALVDAGGDIASGIGSPAGCLPGDLSQMGDRWPVSIADPLAPQDHLGILALGEHGVATSGVDYRRWRQAGRPMHHLIDPRTGLPAETDLLSVSVVAPDVLLAEAAAKTVLILGSQAGLDWLATRPRLAALLVFPDGRLTYGNDLLRYYRS